MDKILGISTKALEVSDAGVKSMVNNLVNAQTPGFKKSGITVHSFSTALEKAGRAIDQRTQGSTMFPKVTGVYQSPLHGPLVRTGANLDIAIGGDSYFVLMGPEGEMFTRDGRFHLDENGSLISTSGGFQLMGTGGPIIVIPGSKIEVNSEGKVIADGSEVDRIRLVLFDRPENLESVNNSLFRLPESGNVTFSDEQNPKVLQGFLESSNVNVMEEMMNMIYLERTFGTVSKLVQTRDASMSRAIEMGRPAQ